MEVYLEELSMELKGDLYEEILGLCSEGDYLVEESMFDAAIKVYFKALDLLPDPKNNWEASTWIYTAIGDTYFIKRDFEASKNYFFEALNCPDGSVNPFILLRLGEILYELKVFDSAKEYLLKAYMLEGTEIFQDEEDKYLKSIIDII
jgi:tetratricopeptide (TPR) repeat protein